MIVGVPMRENECRAQSGLKLMVGYKLDCRWVGENECRAQSGLKLYQHKERRLLQQVRMNAALKAD